MNTNKRVTATPRSDSWKQIKPRIVANEKTQASYAGKATPKAKITKLVSIIDLLRRGQGATLAELMAATSWQAHSVRGALAGAVRQRGFTVASGKSDGTRVYRIVGEPAR